MSNTLTYKTEIIKIPDKVPEKPPSNSKFIISLIIPSIVLFSIAIFIPIALGILISFTNSSSSTGYLGDKIVLTNFYELLFFGRRNSDIFWQYTYQTIFFSVSSLSIEFLLGLGFALILNKSFKGRGLARATLLIPWAIPTVASATIFRFEIFASAGDYGLINSLLLILNADPISFFGPDAQIIFNLPVLIPYEPFLTEVPIKMTMITAIIVDVWKTTPFITLLILAALQIVSEDLYKAGDIAGASSWQKFRHISWPLIKPGVGVALIFRMMQALRVYDAIVVFNDNSVNSMTSQAVALWIRGEFGLASTVSVMLFALIILFAILILFGTRKRDVVEVEEKIERAEVGTIYEEKEKIGYDVEQFIEATEMDYKNKIEAPSQAKVNWYKRKIVIKRILFYIMVIFMCLFCAAPFLWILLRSFRYPYFDLLQTHFELIPQYFSLEPYTILFRESEFIGVSFGRALLNSFVLSGLTVIVVIILASLIAYAIAKFKFQGKSFLNSFIFSMNSLPPLIIIIPFFIQITFASTLIQFLRDINTFLLFSGGVILIIGLFMLTLLIIPKYKEDENFRRSVIRYSIILDIIGVAFIGLAFALPFIKLRDSIFTLVIPYAAVNLPLAIFVLNAFFNEVPEELRLAAKVDGATNFQIFRKVILPLTIPGIFTCSILVFIASWNELLFAQIFLVSDANHTVPRAILRFVQNPLSLTAPWDINITLMAATSLATIPLIIVVLIFQKKIISGLTRGAVKG
ncbi:MAG: ABC transporter permease subunit [Promethearchaeota archaeon]|nr:MAG: ABC transporter permease subunit [Candidatus Lokiarchaeota archaeon]